MNNRHSESRLAKMFNGSIPIVLDSLKQHYFIDRDGKMFRHILNFLRTSSLSIPDNFDHIDLLYEEAKYYDLQAMMRLLEQHVMLMRNRSSFHSLNGQSQLSNVRDNLLLSALKLIPSTRILQPNISYDHHHQHPNKRLCLIRHGSNPRSPYESESTPVGTDSNFQSDSQSQSTFQCLSLHINPDLGERILLSGEKRLVEEVFPEISTKMQESMRSGVAWNQDSKHVIRFPLNGYCKLQSLEAIERLLSHNFDIYASSSGGGPDLSSQFTEYLFVRRITRNPDNDSDQSP